MSAKSPNKVLYCLTEKPAPAKKPQASTGRSFHHSHPQWLPPASASTTRFLLRCQSPSDTHGGQSDAGRIQLLPSFLHTSTGHVRLCSPRVPDQVTHDVICGSKCSLTAPKTLGTFRLPRMRGIDLYPLEIPMTSPRQGFSIDIMSQHWLLSSHDTITCT